MNGTSDAKNESGGAEFAPAQLSKADAQSLKRLRREAGMSTVEIILIIFVAAVILLVLLQVIWPEVLQNVTDKLNDLFQQTGR
jgi:hypothetical protein